jgi:hypothetical protein
VIYVTLNNRRFWAFVCTQRLVLKHNGFLASNAYILARATRKDLARLMNMNNIQKLDNVTWYGHCVIHLMAAINDLPDPAKLALCHDIERFIKRQHRALRDAVTSWQAVEIAGNGNEEARA